MRRVELALLPVSADKRKEILAEIRDDIESRAADAGVKTHQGEERFVKNLESPERLARRYIKIYGVSPAYLALLCILGAILGFLSVPLLPLPDGIYIYPESLAALSVLLLTFYVAWAFLRFPSKSRAVGTAVFTARVAVYLLYALAFQIGFDILDTLLFFITTAGIVALGFALLHFSGEEEQDD
ncbi:MAG: hypothetical protein QW115_02125 [Thermoplasmata archaeon]